jgi:hypothetical protein
METSALIRRNDWPERLAEEVARAQDQPYVLGTWDCLRFSCACIESMTGVDYWPRFAGYSTRREALRTILLIAPTLGDAVTLVLGVPPQPPAFAGRGDVMLYNDGEDHLGICIGATVAVLGADHLAFVPRADPRLLHAWRIG